MGKLRQLRNLISHLRMPPATSSGYQYGYPQAGTFEPDVVGQFVFLFDASDLVDVVSQYVLIIAGTVDPQDSPGTGLWAAFNGIRFVANNSYYDSGSSAPTLNLNTGDFTLEWVSQFSTTKQDSNIIYAYTGPEHGYLLMLQGIDKTYFYFEATDGSAVAKQYVISPTIFDNTTHKHRLVTTGRGTANATMSYYIDGLLMDSDNFASMNGKSIPSSTELMGWNQARAYKCDGIMREFRVSLNSTNNSGGPNGG